MLLCATNTEDFGYLFLKRLFFTFGLIKKKKKKKNSWTNMTSRRLMLYLRPNLDHLMCFTLLILLNHLRGKYCIFAFFKSFLMQKCLTFNVSHFLNVNLKIAA